MVAFGAHDRTNAAFARQTDRTVCTTIVRRWENVFPDENFSKVKTFSQMRRKKKLIRFRLFVFTRRLRTFHVNVCGRVRAPSATPRSLYNHYERRRARVRVWAWRGLRGERTRPPRSSEIFTDSDGERQRLWTSSIFFIIFFPPNILRRLVHRRRRYCFDVVTNASVDDCGFSRVFHTLSPPARRSVTRPSAATTTIVRRRPFVCVCVYGFSVLRASLTRNRRARARAGSTHSRFSGGEKKEEENFCFFFCKFLFDPPPSRRRSLTISDRRGGRGSFFPRSEYDLMFLSTRKPWATLYRRTVSSSYVFQVPTRISLHHGTQIQLFRSKPWVVFSILFACKVFPLSSWRSVSFLFPASAANALVNGQSTFNRSSDDCIRTANNNYSGNYDEYIYINKWYTLTFI